jgi:SET domain-containing protein
MTDSASVEFPKLKFEFTNGRIRVQHSPIHGFGVFAVEDIPANRRVIEYTGEKISDREAVVRFEKIWRSAGDDKKSCLFRLNERYILDGSVGGSGAELINHGCDPNLNKRKVRGHIFYCSRRKIRKGEELTVDYEFSRDAVLVVCRCGSPACRGTINKI